MSVPATHFFGSRSGFTALRRATLAFSALVLLVATLFATNARAEAPRLSVVATTGMVADIARAVGGDAVTVEALMGPGVDPHAFRQTRTDIVKLTEADLVLWNGLYLEAQLEELLHDFAARKPVVAVAEAVPTDRLLSHDEYDGRFDPHIWMDPSLWAEAVRAARDAMAELRPALADAFAANTEAYLKDLAALGAYGKAALESVPEGRRVLITAHDAFNYFGAAHGFEVLGIQGISTESEAGLKRIEDLVDLLVTREIASVFVETSVADRNMRAIIEGAAARGHTVTIGGELYSDAMGEPGTYEGTYLGMIDHNATTITRALGGTAPALGMAGRLSAGG